MAGGISVHAVDVSRGVPAEGLEVWVYALDPDRRVVANGTLGADGALRHPVTTGQGVGPGIYEVVFQIGEYLRAAGVVQAEPAFLEEVPFRFAIADATQHYHLPMKFTPWGYSLFRGS